MIDKLMHWLTYYIGMGFQFIIQHLMTMEGIIGLLFGLFFIGLISRIRSEF